MEYMLLVYSDEQGMAATPPEQMQAVMGAYMAYTQALQDADVLRGGNRLRPTAATTTVRVTDGQRRLVDGPFAETKEQLLVEGLSDGPDLDAALDWASRCPGAQHGSVEVRPIWTM